MSLSQQLQALLEKIIPKAFADVTLPHVPSARHAVASRAAQSERQPPDIMAGPLSSIHPPPTLARGATGKAVLALEVRSRTLQIAAWAETPRLRAHGMSRSVPVVVGHCFMNVW